jgi:hypothetical protein
MADLLRLPLLDGCPTATEKRRLLQTDDRRRRGAERDVERDPRASAHRSDAYRLRVVNRRRQRDVKHRRRHLHPKVVRYRRRLHLMVVTAANLLRLTVASGPHRRHPRKAVKSCRLHRVRRRHRPVHRRLLDRRPHHRVRHHERTRSQFQKRRRTRSPLQGSKEFESASSLSFYSIDFNAADAGLRVAVERAVI